MPLQSPVSHPNYRFDTNHDHSRSFVGSHGPGGHATVMASSVCAGFSPGSIRDKWERIRSLVALCGFPNEAENLENATELLSSEKSDWTSRYRLHRLRNRNASADVVELVDFALEQNWNDLLALMGIQSEKSPSWDWEIEKDSFL